MKPLFALTALSLVAACAQSPDAIAPATMSGAFERLSCKQVQQQLFDHQAKLSTLSVQQQRAVNGDFIGVLFIGVPVSSAFGGDKAGQIAAEKGAVLSLQQRLLTCK